MSGTRVAKKEPANSFRYRRAVGLRGLKARQPMVQGSVATRYEIIKMSCQSWSSVEVTYVHPPHVSVRKMPTPATNLGSAEFGRRVKQYHRPTNAKRGPNCDFSEVRASPISSHTRCKGNKQHEYGTLGVTVANGRRHRGEPFLRIALLAL
jgi:hypothetical protein